MIEHILITLLALLAGVGIGWLICDAMDVHRPDTEHDAFERQEGE